MTTERALAWVGFMGALVVAWTAVYLVIAARRARRLRGMDVGNEERRLRHDPRFLDSWVESLKREGRVGDAPPPREPPAAT